MVQEDKVMYTLTKEELNEKALVYIGRVSDRHGCI